MQRQSQDPIIRILKIIGLVGAIIIPTGSSVLFIQSQAQNTVQEHNVNSQSHEDIRITNDLQWQAINKIQEEFTKYIKETHPKEVQVASDSIVSRIIRGVNR